MPSDWRIARKQRRDGQRAARLAYLLRCAARYICEICGRRTSSIYRLVYASGDVWACGACADLREDEAP